MGGRVRVGGAGHNGAQREVPGTFSAPSQAPLGGPTRISALRRLRSLAPIFSLADLEVHFEFDPAVARVTFGRWCKAGLAERLGGGVYFNLIADPEGPQARVGEALDELPRRRLVFVGGAALHRAGWTTQIHRRHEIAVPVARGRLTVPRIRLGYALVPRRARWHAVLRKHGDRGLGMPGIESVTPEMDLADALLMQGRPLARRYPTYVVPPDEMDLRELTPTHLGRVVGAPGALGALGASEQLALGLLKAYRGVFGPES